MHTLTFFCEGRAWRLLLSGRGLRAALLVGLGVLLPLLGYAEEARRVQPYLLSASRLYDALEYEGALEELGKARRFAASDEEVVLLSLYEGAIQADLGRTEASDAAFKAALSLQPEAKLPLPVSPKVAQRLEAIRQQLKLELEAKVQARAATVPPPPSTEAPAIQGQPLSPQPPVSQVQPAPDVLAYVPSAGAPPVPAAPELPPRAAIAPVSSGKATRTRAWLPATIGGGLLVGGGVSYLLARGEQSRLRGNDAGLASLEDVKRSVSRGRTYQAVGLTLAGAGVVGLGISAGMYLLGRPPKAQELAIDVSTDGTSAFVFGRWP